ncbi:hypothetical protein BaRGS_00011856 [Batillaria attramentaria]|uniref:Uncharacterized protein n=1 Tax=Batillaria attramentaria TaxID=370345 RepID=A0ABD0LCL2_9CAEN
MHVLYRAWTSRGFETGSCPSYTGPLAAAAGIWLPGTWPIVAQSDLSRLAPVCIVRPDLRTGKPPLDVLCGRWQRIVWELPEKRLLGSGCEGEVLFYNVLA